MRNSIAAMTWRVLAGSLAVVLTAGAAWGQVKFYEKQPSLQQTMLATRVRLQQWQAA
jgi:hypothetical protein